MCSQKTTERGKHIFYLMSANGQSSMESYCHSDIPKSAGRERAAGTRSEVGLPGTVPKMEERAGLIITAVLSPLRAQIRIWHF